ncbi:hypothetical protein Tco_0356102 [Tanacetum coccineum]
METANDEEVARKVQEEWDAEEERKRLEGLKKAKTKTILKKPTSLAQERNRMMNFLKGQGYKNLQKLRYPQMKELYDKVQESIKDSFKDFIPNGQERKHLHTLELEDGTMIHMLTERRYPLSRKLMIRMLNHGMEVEDESGIAITLIHLFILWTTEDGDDS